MVEPNYNFSSEDHAAFHTALATNLTKPHYKSRLSEEEERFLQDIIEKNPSLIDSLFDTILMTFQNHVLDLHLVPSLVLLLFRALTGYFSELDDKQQSSVDLTAILRFVVDSLIDSELFFLPDVKRALLKKTVDTSLDLLRSSLPVLIKEEQRCCGWLLSAFVPAKHR